MEEPSHKTVYQFVREHPRPFVETVEVAEEFDEKARRTIFGRLQDLADRGDLKKREIGANDVVWWDPQRASERVSLPASDSQ
jgi:hypothetical protein